MTYDTSNPVSIGFGTKKNHYDELWDNADWLRQVLAKILTPWHATTLESNVLFPGLVIRPKFVFVESLDYTSGGTHELVVGDTVEGETGGATGYIEHITLTSGAWGDGDAAGTIYLTTRNAIAFQAAETLKDNGNLNCATVTAASSKDSIVLYPGVYQHQGTTGQLIYWNSKIAFEFQNLAASDWSYLYLDDSAIQTLGSNLITSSEFIDATTEPAWSNAKHGWYNGEDRCIFAVTTDGSSNIWEFFHEGDLVLYADYLTDAAANDIDTSWVDVTLTIPKFTTKAETVFSAIFNAAEYGYWRTNGQTATTGHFGTRIGAGATIELSTFPVITDSTQKIEIKFDALGDDTIAIYTEGWWFPIGL